MLMGEDFRYQNAKMQFKSIDKLIKYFNAHANNVTLMYSTPSKYIDAINRLNVDWATKYDDMFPYADSGESYWTGYFSSRANHKEYIRRASNNLHASNKLYALKVIDQKAGDLAISNIQNVKEKFLDVMGVNQHHDAITGTSK